MLGSYRVHELGRTLTLLGTPQRDAEGPYFHSSLLLLRSINVAHAACHLSFKDQAGGPKVYGDMCTPHFILSFMPCG